MTAAELRPRDAVRFPDGNGGHVWATVCRVLGTGGSVDVLFTDGDGGSEYRTFPAEQKLVVRRGTAA